MLCCIFLRRGCRLGFSRRRRRNNRCDFVFLDEHISKVGFDLEHVVFVADDHAVKLLAVLEANLICTRGKTDRAERYSECRNKKGAALYGDSHTGSIPLPSVGCNLHTPAGVPRATSASSASVRATDRSRSSIASLGAGPQRFTQLCVTLLECQRFRNFQTETTISMRTAARRVNNLPNNSFAAASNSRSSLVGLPSRTVWCVEK